jgi:hypothetical protein
MRTKRRWPSRRALLFYVGSYVVIWSAFFAFFWTVGSRDRQLGDELASHGVITTATVTQSTPENHDTICFTYDVNGTQYSGCGAADFGKNASQLPPGSQTKVIYDARNPAVYCSCTPAELQQNGYQAPFIGAFWLGTFVWAGIATSRLWLLRRPPKSVAPLSVQPRPEPFVPGRRTWTHPHLPSWFWSGGVVTYDTPLSSSEVTARLGQAIRPEGLFDSLAAPGKLRGWIQGPRFRVTTHLFLLSNSFNSILDGQIDDVLGGSRLTGKFRLRGFVFGFMIFWLALATVIGLVITVSVLVDPQGWTPSAPPFYVGLIFPTFGIGLMIVGRLIARIQERTILRRLEETLGMPSA